MEERFDPLYSQHQCILNNPFNPQIFSTSIRQGNVEVIQHGKQPLREKILLAQERNVYPFILSAENKVIQKQTAAAGPLRSSALGSRVHYTLIRILYNCMATVLLPVVEFCKNAEN